MTHQPNNVSAAGVLTDEQITAAARALSNHNADVCNVNREDNWMIYGDDFRESAKVALLAAASAQATAPVGWFVQRSSFGPWIEVERYEDGAVRLHRMDGDQATGPAVPKLSVWYGPMPESNGKTNWTAILHRGDVWKGITIDRSEYPDRVRYEADLMRWMIGELEKEPFILDYDADKHSGYVAPSPAAREAGDGVKVDWHDICAALIDIYDDAMNNAPEDRCCVEGAWKEELDKARALLREAGSR